MIGAVADLTKFLGPHTPVSQMIDKLELVYGTVASFDILMLNVYKLKTGENQWLPAYVTCLEGALSAVQKDHPHMLSQTEIHNNY